LSTIEHAASSIASGLSGLAGKGASAIIGALPTPHLPSWMGNLGGWVVGQVANWIKSGFQEKKFGQLTSGGTGSLPGTGASVPGHPELQGGISRIVNDVLQHFPGLAITSTLRPGDPGFHGLGRAADLAGSTGYMYKAAAWVASHLGASLTEGIHNPDLSIKYGKGVPASYWGAAKWAEHLNHIHLAYRKGGRISTGGLAERRHIMAELAHAASVKGLSKSNRGVLENWAEVWDELPWSARGYHRTATHSWLQSILPGGWGVNRHNLISPGPHGFGKGHEPMYFAKGGKLPSWVHGSGTLNADQLASLAHYAGMPHPGLMAQIAEAESGGNPHSMGGAGDKGLWQIIPSTASAFGINYGSLFDPLVNARGAAKILAGQGLGAWSTYNSGAYRSQPKGTVSALGALGGAGTGSSFTPHFGLSKGHIVSLPPLGASPLLPSAAGLSGQWKHLLKSPGLSYSGKLGIGEAAQSAAEAAGDVPGEEAAKAFERELLTRNEARLRARINKIDRELKSKRLTPKQRAAKIAAREQAREGLASAESSMTGLAEGSGEESAAEKAAQEQKEATEKLTEAIKEQQAAEEELSKELKRQTDFAQSATATSSATAWKALSDILSGNLGAATLHRSGLAGAGKQGSW
ncbi:MAG: transglycosylase SLT domain-containing protein, partial [Solirubrobacterales bacterium]